MMRIALAGAAYFAIVFAAGFMCGVAREVLLTPALGSTLATLIEAPVMLTVCVFAARAITRRVAAARGAPLAIGGVAFALLIAAEAGFASVIRGWPLRTWLEHFLTPDGAIALAMFVVFALMPVLAGGRRR